MQKLSSLLTQRDALLRQARLANLAFAYATLGEFSRRIARAHLRGQVVLRHASAEEERYWASLNALEGHQAVIEEHFDDQDLMDLADVIAFVSVHDALDVTFQLEDIEGVFMAPLRDELGRAGIAIDRPDATADVTR